MEQKIRELINILKTHDNIDRLNAELKLIEIGEMAIPYLIEGLQQHDHKKIQKISARILSKIKGGVEAAREDLFLASEQENDLKLKSHALIALSSSKDPEVMKEVERRTVELLEYLKSENKTIRALISWTLGCIKLKIAEAPLIELLSDSEEWVRAHASEALCRIGEIDNAIPMLQDSSSFVRSRTAHAMGEIGPQVASKNADIYLIHLLKDPDDRVRKDAEWALSKINTPDARRALRYEIQQYS